MIRGRHLGPLYLDVWRDEDEGRRWTDWTFVIDLGRWSWSLTVGWSRPA